MITIDKAVLSTCVALGGTVSLSPREQIHKKRIEMYDFEWSVKLQGGKGHVEHDNILP